MRIAALTYRIASGHRHTIFTRWLLLSAQLERRAIFILFSLFVCTPDFFKAVLTDSVFNPTGIGLRSFGVNACGDKLLGKEAVTLVDFFGNFPANIGQMEKVIFVHHKKTTVPQGSHRMAHAGLGYLHVPGNIHGAYHAHLLVENKYGLQVVLPGRMKFHVAVLPQIIRQCSSPLPAHGL